MTHIDAHCPTCGAALDIIVDLTIDRAATGPIDPPPPDDANPPVSGSTTGTK